MSGAKINSLTLTLLFLMPSVSVISLLMSYKWVYENVCSKDNCSCQSASETFCLQQVEIHFSSVCILD